MTRSPPPVRSTGRRGPGGSVRGGGHRPALGRHPVGQVRPQSCNRGQAGLLQLVLERVGGKRRHGGRVSRVPGADVASVHGLAWLATPKAGRGTMLPARVPSPAAYAPRQRGVGELSEFPLSLQAQARCPNQDLCLSFSSLEKTNKKRPQGQIFFGTPWQTLC